MNLNKKLFTPAEAGLIMDALKKAATRGLLQPVVENNQYLMCAYNGTGTLSPKWSVKLYSFSKNKKGHSMICTDSEVLKCFLAGNFDLQPPDLKLLKIDDSGWGFPLCGVMVGVSDEIIVHTDIVPVEFFQDSNFTSKKYLEEYSIRGLKIVYEKFGASPDTHRIEICTGFVNSMLREKLRESGFYVGVTEITGLLQNELEERFKCYIAGELNSDIYYDPKEIDAAGLPMQFHRALEFGKKFFPHKLKTGWRSISGSSL